MWFASTSHFTPPSKIYNIPPPSRRQPPCGMTGSKRTPVLPIPSEYHFINAKLIQSVRTGHTEIPASILGFSTNAYLGDQHDVRHASNRKHGRTVNDELLYGHAIRYTSQTVLVSSGSGVFRAVLPRVKEGGG